jgi:GT2 family glycosyltransferase
MFHSVIIASTGRPEILGATVSSLRQQTVSPDEIIIALTEQADLPPMSEMGALVRVIFAPRGVTRQLNAAVAQTDLRCELVSIFDDDVELAPEYLAKVREFFRVHSDVIFFDGECAAHGVIDHIQARKILQLQSEGSESFRQGCSVWGCNMNIRRWVLDRERFDETVALYGWLHEFDFGHRVEKLGRCGRYSGCRFVHLEVPSGRISGVKHGFLQVMNAVYFYKKKTVVQSFPDLVFGHLVKTPAINAYWLLRGDTRVDRWGRLRGNFRALAAALAGNSDPRAVENIE